MEGLNVEKMLEDEGAIDLEVLDVGHVLRDEGAIESSYDINFDNADNSIDHITDLKYIGFEEDWVPTVGMLFEDVKKMLQFYNRYGQRMGFSVKMRTVNKGIDGNAKYVTLTCTRADKYISRSKKVINYRPNSKIGCMARIRARLSLEGMWEITGFQDQHNHLVSPSQSRYFSCNRQIKPHIQRQLEINDMAGIRPNKSHNAQVIGAGGHENLQFIEQDTRNYVAKVRRMRLGQGDVDAVQNYFLKMQSNNDGFFWLIDWDDKGRLKNVFWADPRSRAACREFGDVITFDTTYLTNKYDMPFAPFVGVNHHGQSILLGCGLISNEDTGTFVWLFKTWLACMFNVPPLGIITDQDKAMKNAIRIVFPNARHRLCLWHILKKVPEKLGSYKDYERITYDLGDVVYESQSIQEFESGWNLMIVKFQLGDNAWLAQLFEDRELWVPIFVKKFFWAGMSTTQRSESMNAFFDGYLNSKTTLKQFVEQYNNALRKKVEKENQADFNSFHKLLECVTIFDMEKRIRVLYTESKFKEFQIELLGTMYCIVKSVEKNVGFDQYFVEEYVVYGDKGKKNVVFKVCYNALQASVKCSCFRFEFRGIICRHAIKVLLSNGIDLIPPQYVFNRWRKDVRRSHTRVKINYEGWIITPEQQRYDHLCHLFSKVADLAAGNDDHYNMVLQWIEGAVDSMPISPVVPLMIGNSSIDPVTKRGKGRPPTLRKQKIFKRKGCSTRRGSIQVGNQDEGTSGV